MPSSPFDKLFAGARTGSKSLAAGEFLFRKGEAASRLYTVLEGSLRLVRYSLEGNAVSMHTALPGESFAEASLFSPIYHCDAEAILPTTIACYDKEKILALLAADPAKNASLIALLCRQVRNLRALLEVRSIRSARARLLHFLLLTAEPQTMTVALTGTVKELAQELAMAHETLYRTMAALEKEGKISRSEGRITIHPDAALTDNSQSFG